MGEIDTRTLTEFLWVHGAPIDEVLDTVYNHPTQVGLKATAFAMSISPAELRGITTSLAADRAAIIKAYNKIMELRRQHHEQERREQQHQQEEAEKARQTAEEATRDYADRMALLQAEIAQDEKKLEILKRQQRIVELTADYRRKGLEDAEQLARQMVEAELNAEIAREKNRERQNRGNNRMSSAWIQGSQAGVGGGGRSYLIGGGPMLTESKKHTTLLREVRDAVRKRQQVKVTGNVEAVLGD